VNPIFSSLDAAAPYKAANPSSPSFVRCSSGTICLYLSEPSLYIPLNSAMPPGPPEAIVTPHTGRAPTPSAAFPSMLSWISFGTSRVRRFSSAKSSQYWEKSSKTEVRSFGWKLGKTAFVRWSCISPASLSELAITRLKPEAIDTKALDAPEADIRIRPSAQSGSTSKSILLLTCGMARCKSVLENASAPSAFSVSRMCPHCAASPFDTI